MKRRFFRPWDSESRGSAGRRWRRRRSLLTITAPWQGPVIALMAVVLAGACGYRLTEGWDWGDCFWMVLITMPRALAASSVSGYFTSSW